MILKVIGLVLKFFHGILIALLWLSPLYLTNPALLLGAIAFQSAILAHQKFLNDKCILTIWEESLTGQKIKYHKGKSMAGFNGILSTWIGTEGMLRVNTFIPYSAIIANCAKIYLGL